MTPEEFVTAIKTTVTRSAASGVIAGLRKPPGRRPPEIERHLSDWYTHLSLEDQEVVATIVRRACELAGYSFLAVLDGIMAIESVTEKGTLVLFYDSDHERTQLNDPAKELLTSVYKHD